MHLPRSQGCPCLPANGGGYEEESSSFLGNQLYLGIPVCNHDANRIVYVKKTQSIYGSCNHVSGTGDLDSQFPDSRYPAIRPNEVSKSGCNNAAGSRYRQGRPVVIAVGRDTTGSSLMRSLMFRSEQSIHQKYQTLLDKDQIVRVPTAFCFNSSGQFVRRLPVDASKIDGIIAQTPVFQRLEMSVPAVPVMECNGNHLRGKRQCPVRMFKRNSFKESRRYTSRLSKDNASQ